MTRARAQIAQSLAERGRPELWADDEESALLSGMTMERFRAHLTLLENEGFPKPSPWNGKRFIPAIVAFWHKENGLDALIGAASAGNHDEDGRDKWGTNDRKQRQS